MVTNNWQSSNYGQNPPVKCPFDNYCWYEIGFLNHYSNIFIHQGIRQYINGFQGENGYNLKPFPTHFKKINLSTDFPSN
jgi:hypothetical protein